MHVPAECLCFRQRHFHAAKLQQKNVVRVMDCQPPQRRPAAEQERRRLLFVLDIGNGQVHVEEAGKDFYPY